MSLLTFKHSHRRNAGTPERRNAGTPERRNAGTPERHYKPTAPVGLALCAIFLLILAGPAQATLNCVKSISPSPTITVNVYETDDLMPLGPVGVWNAHHIYFDCTPTTGTWSQKVGITFVPTAHTSTIFDTGHTAIRDTGSPSFKVFSTPQLQALGLGYMLYWHTNIVAPSVPDPISPGTTLTTVAQMIPDNNFRTVNSNSFTVDAIVWVHYVKIASLASYETAYPVASGQSPLGSFFVSDSTTPSVPPANQIQDVSVPAPSLTLTRRTCTTPSPTYDLGQANFDADFPAIGSTGPALEFTLTFNCPHGYNFVGISFVPVQGAANEALHPGVTNSNLPGVGVQLLTRLQQKEYPSNNPAPLLPDWQPVKFGHAYWLRQYLRPDPGNPDIRNDYSETFRARYYRTGNTSGGGQMKAAVWVVMVYK